MHFVTRLKDTATYIVVEPRQAAGEGMRDTGIVVLETGPLNQRIRVHGFVSPPQSLDLDAGTKAGGNRERVGFDLLLEQD